MPITRRPLGSRVLICSSPAIDTRAGQEATVIYHGRDKGGVYTRVRFDDGDEEEYHRASLKSVRCASYSRVYGVTRECRRPAKPGKRFCVKHSYQEET